MSRLRGGADKGQDSSLQKHSGSMAIGANLACFQCCISANLELSVYVCLCSCGTHGMQSQRVVMLGQDAYRVARKVQFTHLRDDVIQCSVAEGVLARVVIMLISVGIVR